MVFFHPIPLKRIKSNLFEIESNETDSVCLWNLGPREPSEVGKDGDSGCRSSDWTGQKLTSSWLAMYLGSYFDRRYHCESKDKLS